MKKMLAIAVAAAFAAPAVSMADTTLYGIAKAGLWNINEETDMRDDGARIGVKGSTPLNNGLAATYVIEYGTDITDNGGAISNRQSYVGVKGGYGEIRAGKMWGPTKLSSGKVEMFGDRLGDYNSKLGTGAGMQSGANPNAGGNFTVEPSVRDSIAYVNKFGNVGVAAMVTEDISGGTSGAGDLSAIDSVVSYSNNGLYLALAHQDVHTAPDTTRLTAAYKFPAGHQIGAAFEKVDNGTAGEDIDSVVVSGKYAMGNAALKAQYANSDFGTNGDSNQFTVGVDYKLGKKTTIYADAATGEDTAGADKDGYGVGIVHAF